MIGSRRAHRAASVLVLAGLAFWLVVGPWNVALAEMPPREPEAPPEPPPVQP